MADWRECRLGDLGVVVGGGTPPRERVEYWNGSIPWLTPGELTGNSDKYVFETEDYISELGLAASGARLLSEGSLLVTSRASIGSCALAGRPMATNQGFKNVTPGTEVDPSFLFHVGRTLGKEMTRRASGTTFLEISGREFKSINVRLPPLEEQRRIAEILDTIDEAFQATKRAITKHERVRAGLAAVLLSDGAGDASELDTPLPQERGMAARRAVALGEIVQILDSRRVPVREEDRPSGSVPYYGANGQQGWMDRALFDEPLILLAEDGGHFEEFADRPIAYRIDGPAWVNNHAHVLRAARGVDQSYLFWSLRNKDIRRWIAGGTRSKLTQAEMERIRLFIPPLEEQRQIAATLDAVDEVIQGTEAELDKLWRLLSGLAADLLSGQVRTVTA